MFAGRAPARRTIARVAPVPVLIFITACGAPRVALPSGAGTPSPDSVASYTEATRECRGVKTLSATLSLSGRAGSSKLSARIDAGFSDPGRLRLEGYPRVNFGGKPFFVLVANGRDATLVLTRDGRVLRGAAPADIIEALAGIALEPDDMRALVAGCALGNGEPADGRSFEGGWASVETGNATVFLHQVENQWRVAGLRRGSLSVEYSEFGDGHPATVHLRTTASQNVAAADLTIHISQREANVPLETAVFSVDVPKDAAPLTLEELRRAGPLGGGTPDGTEAAEDTGQDQHGAAETRTGRRSRRASRGKSSE
jgi:hypothetical protein